MKNKWIKKSGELATILSGPQAERLKSTKPKTR